MNKKLPGISPPFIIPVKGNFGIDDSERCIEIPWALSLYNGENIVLDVGYAHAEKRYISGLLSLNIPYLHGIDIVEKHIDGIIPHTMDIRKTSFNDNYFDMVFCLSTLEHIGRDISRYTHHYAEITGNGDFDALREIVRITNNGGKIVLTVPYGKEGDYGWSIQYNESRLHMLITSLPLQILVEDYFIFSNGWHKCDKKILENVAYQDNKAQAAAGLACIFLQKTEHSGVVTGNKNFNGNSMVDHDISIKDAKNLAGRSEIHVNDQKNPGEQLEKGKPSPDVRYPVSVPDNSMSWETDGEFLHRYLEYLNRTWDIHNDTYEITSHRPILGNALVHGRRIINSEVRRYVDPTIFQQTEFNANTVRILNWLVNRIEELERKLKEQEDISTESNGNVNKPAKKE